MGAASFIMPPLALIVAQGCIMDIELHQSSLGSYLICPRRFYYDQIMTYSTSASPAAYFGSAVHYTAAQYFGSRMQNGNVFGEEELVDLFSREFATGEDYGKLSSRWDGTIAAESQELKVLERQGKTLIHLALPQWEKVTPIMIEQSIHRTITLPDGSEQAIGGRLDLLDSNGVLIDFKTAGRSWPQGKEHKTIQIGFYALLMGGPTQADYHIMVRQPAKYEVRHTERTEDEMGYLVDEIIFPTIRLIEAGFFPCCDPEHFLCTSEWCSYWNRCPRSRT